MQRKFTTPLAQPLPYIIKFRIACLLCILFWGILIPLANAQEPRVDDLAKHLGKEIAKAKFKSVVVADFTTIDGEASAEGKILAGRLADYWHSHKEKFCSSSAPSLRPC